MDLGILFLIIAATIIDSSVSLIGVFSLWIKDKTVQKMLLILVAFSAGALLSGALVHLVAESLANMEATMTFTVLLIGFISFFILERYIHWHHCHEGKCEEHPMTYLVLIGDGAHNFIDGLVIAASFMVNITFGWITTLLVIVHEIPQELGDFGILVYGGFEKKKALTFNLFSQMTCILGGLAGFFLVESFSSAFAYLLPFAAGGFIYIAASDLIPELHKEKDMKKSFISFLFFIVGVLFIFGTKILLGE
jgi:zinc and cadmium transporter